MDDFQWNPKWSSWAALTSLTFLTGCSNAQQVEYDFPQNLCGVPVDRSVIEPLFPAGKELTQTGDSLADGQDQSSCSYLVDGNPALSFSDQRYEEKLTAPDVLKKTAPGSQASEISVTSSGHVAMYRGHAVGVADHTGLPSDVEGEESQVYAITVGIGNPKDWQEAQDKLTQFMRKFLPTAAKADGC